MLPNIKYCLGRAVFDCFFALGFLFSVYWVIMAIKGLIGTTSGVFIVNSETCTLKMKFKGEDIFIQRSNKDIQRIVLKNFMMKYRCIILEDSIGKFCEGARSEKGDYIKIQYTESNLANIKRFLPHCPVVESSNPSPKQLF